MSEEYTLSEETEESSAFFMIISPDVKFAESSYEFDEEGKQSFSVKILATVLELEKPSANGRLYQFSEGESIAQSLVGKPIYYGVNYLGKHDNPIFSASSENEPCGIVEKAFVEGQKIKAKIKITLSSLIEKIRSGTKFLFSVGGHAITETLKTIGGKIVRVLHNARCNHLQIVDSTVKVGFPSAKMERILEFGETVLFIESEEGEEIIVEPEKPEVHTREVYGKIQELPEGQKKEHLKKEFEQIKKDEDDNEKEYGELELCESEDESYVLTED